MASDGNFSIYMDADDMDYLVTGEGSTIAEALDMFKSGYEDMRLYHMNHNEPFEEVEFEYVYDTASFLAYYAKAFTLAGISRITGINAGQLSHYATGHRKPSTKTVKKIEQGIKAFAADLSRVSLV